MKNEWMERYFRKYYPLAYRVAFLYMKTHEDAEDIAQEIFLRLLKYRPELKSEEHEKAWIIRAVTNLCHDVCKSKWHSTTVPIDKVPELEKEYFKVPYIQEDETLWAVMSLTEKYRNALYFFYYEDYSIKEIAEIRNIPQNTVKTDLRRGRELLKEVLLKEKSNV